MPNGDRLWLAESVLVVLREIADQHCPLETGGMLLGYEAKNGEAVVSAVIGPGPKAKHSRFRFVPDAKYQQAELENHFYKTDGRETYLGDWHTHPLGSCHLSVVDKWTLARIARTPSSGTQHPIMAILCGSNADWQIGAVRFLSAKSSFLLKRCSLAQLNPLIFTNLNQRITK